jgi:hypothetical protein
MPVAPEASPARDSRFHAGSSKAHRQGPEMAKDMSLASLLSVMGVSEAAMMWRELRLENGSGVLAKPKTCFVLPDIN